MLKRNAKSTNLKSVGLIFCIFCIAACSQGKSPVDVRETISREVESERLGGRVVTIIRPGDGMACQIKIRFMLGNVCV